MWHHASIWDKQHKNMILDTLTTWAWHQIVGKEQGEEVMSSETKIYCLQMTLPSVCWEVGGVQVSQVRRSTLVWKLYEGNISQAMSSSIFWLNKFTFLYHSSTQLKCPHHGQGIGGSWLQSVRASCRAANGRGQLGNTVNKGWKPGDEILSARQNPLNPNTPTLLIRR